MKVLGLGFPRTGTLSTHAALTMLGFPCYHMGQLAMRPEHIRAWHAYVCRGRPLDFEAIYAGFEATVDAPGAFLWRELLAAFPQAKVLLNVRDAQAWYASYQRLHAAIDELRPERRHNRLFDQWLEIVETLERRVVGDVDNPEAWLRAFNRHNEEVRRTVAPEQLLVFRVQDGWQPLCRFLEVPVPEEPFPHLNEGGETVRLGLKAIFGLD